jgi:hypothetical protein
LSLLNNDQSSDASLNPALSAAERLLLTQTQEQLFAYDVATAMSLWRSEAPASEASAAA